MAALKNNPAQSLGQRGGAESPTLTLSSPLLPSRQFPFAGPGHSHCFVSERSPVSLARYSWKKGQEMYLFIIWSVYKKESVCCRKFGNIEKHKKENKNYPWDNHQVHFVESLSDVFPNHICICTPCVCDHSMGYLRIFWFNMLWVFMSLNFILSRILKMKFKYHWFFKNQLYWGLISMQWDPFHFAVQWVFTNVFIPLSTITIKKENTITTKCPLAGNLCLLGPRQPPIWILPLQMFYLYLL